MSAHELMTLVMFVITMVNFVTGSIVSLAYIMMLNKLNDNVKALMLTHDKTDTTEKLSIRTTLNDRVLGVIDWNRK